MKIVLMELAFLVFQATVGIVIFTTLFWLGVLSQSISVLMYRGISIALLAAIIQVTFCVFTASGRAQQRSSQSQVSRIAGGTALAFAVNITFLVVVPVTIDRSVTVYLLGQLARNAPGLSEVEMRDKLVGQYVGEYGAVQRRMQEQMKSGNVILEGQTYRLSAQGQRFIQFSNSIADIFGADPRYIRGEAAPRSGDLYDHSKTH